VNSSTGDDVSKESKLSNTSVLDLYVTKTVESLLVSIIKKSKWIEESKWWLCSKLRLESVKSSGGLCNLGRSESRCSCDKGSEDLWFMSSLEESSQLLDRCKLILRILFS